MSDLLNTIFANRTPLETVTIIAFVLKLLYNAEIYIADYLQKVPFSFPSRNFIILNAFWIATFLIKDFPFREYILGFFLLGLLVAFYRKMSFKDEINADYIPGYYSAVINVLVLFTLFLKNFIVR